MKALDEIHNYKQMTFLRKLKVRGSIGSMLRHAEQYFRGIALGNFYGKSQIQIHLFQKLNASLYSYKL